MKKHVIYNIEYDQYLAIDPKTYFKYVNKINHAIIYPYNDILAIKNKTSYGGTFIRRTRDFCEYNAESILIVPIFIKESKFFLLNINSIMPDFVQSFKL